jgi:hypothetical protein
MFMDTKESIAAMAKVTVQYIKKAEQTDEFCEDMICVMLKTAYDKGREDVHSGQMNDIESYDPLFSHTFD